MVTFDDAAKRRIRFLTRRGLLELDIVLKRFMEKEFQHLSNAELSVFVEILDLPDQEFFGSGQSERNNRQSSVCIAAG